MDLSSISPTTCASAGIFVVSKEEDLWRSILRQELERRKISSPNLEKISQNVISQIISFVEETNLEFACAVTNEGLVSTFVAIIAVSQATVQVYLELC